MKRHVHRVAVVLMACALLAGCGGEEAIETTLAPDLPTLLGSAAVTMGEVDSVHFTFALSGAPVFIDTAGLVAFVDAEGRYVAPDLADALITVKAAGISTQIGAVAFEGETYLTNPFSGGWEPTPDNFGFDPATLFDPDEGWRPLFAGGLSDATYVGLEEIDGEPFHHVNGVGEAARIKVITATLVEEPTELDIWLSPIDASVRRVTFDTTLDGAVSSWQLDLDGYGETYTIDRPDLTG